MTREQSISRRRFTAFGIGLALMPRFQRSAFAEVAPSKSAQRVIALDWGVAETLVALGHPPLGAAEIPNYGRTVVTPPIPPNVVDVGLRLSPNPEIMQQLNPDLILINAAQDYMRPSLVRFAPVEIVQIYAAAGQPYRLSVEATSTLATALNDAPAAMRLLAEAEAVMAAGRAKLQGYDGRPVYVIAFADGRHIGVAGSDSLFQGVLDQLGLRNAWTAKAGGWGVAYAGIEALLADRDARIVYLSPLPEEAKRTLANGLLWHRLPAVQARRVAALPPVWAYGALPSAMRFARLISNALAEPEVMHE